MTIELLSPEEHAELLNAYQNYPELFLQNNGYEYIVKSELSEVAKDQLNKIESLLKTHIKGFSSFSNFRHDRDGNIVLRVQYY